MVDKLIVKLLNCSIATSPPPSPRRRGNNLAIQQFNNCLHRGFTLIELLIVIAVLGILVTGILVVLNPVEQTRRANDASRASSVSQLATAITAYSTSQLISSYTALDVEDWQGVLVGAQEIKNPIKVPVPKEASPCNTTGGNRDHDTDPRHVCLRIYSVGGTNNVVAIWANLDSEAEKTRAGCNTTYPYPIVAYSSSQQKTGIGCLTAANATTGKKGAGTVAIYDIDLK